MRKPEYSLLQSLPFSHWGTDSGSAPERCVKQVLQEFLPTNNFGMHVRLCRGHMFGNAAAVTLTDTLSILVKKSRLIRSAEYHNTWLSSMCNEALTKIATGMHHITKGIATV